MDESLSTREMARVLRRSPAAVRDTIRNGAIDGVRIPAGFRIPKAEALRLARARAEVESGRKLSDRGFERAIDEVISTNEDRNGVPGSGRPPLRERRPARTALSRSPASRRPAGGS